MSGTKSRFAVYTVLSKTFGCIWVEMSSLLKCFLNPYFDQWSTDVCFRVSSDHHHVCPKRCRVFEAPSLSLHLNWIGCDALLYGIGEGLSSDGIDRYLYGDIQARKLRWSQSSKTIAARYPLYKVRRLANVIAIRYLRSVRFPLSQPISTSRNSTYQGYYSESPR